MECVVLPALNRLDFRGITEYLERLVGRVCTPRLGDVEITFFGGVIFDVPKLRRFIDPIGMQQSHSRAEVLFSEHTFSSFGFDSTARMVRL